ncbi:SPOR domain-containing protein [Kaistia nematophila]|uniref:SPOR domain-containing protein n=1 Tax=Kaistia nematophila TaxID=2994654 RepID=A0A9X3DZY3_9HYPH|nr:SPOR domain-containing protein [Kaistia nematophila]MCX5568842.1 SPOR domain-containing protein [Kaistia nematophila]
MADRYDNSFSRRPPPLGEDLARRNAQPAPTEEDPLVELARMVSGNSSFDDIVGGRAQPAAPVVRPAQQANVRDTSFDLESELMNDLQSSFDPATRAAAGRPLQVEPQPPRAAPPRDEGFDHMRLRPGAPAAPPPNWQAAQAQRAVDSRYTQEPRYAQEAYAQPAVEEADPYAGTAYAGAADYGRDPRGQSAPAAGYAQQDHYYSGQENGADDHSTGYDAEYGDDANGGYDDEGYEERHAHPERYAEPRRSRKGLIIAASVLAIVLAGGLGALALKGGDGVATSGAPRVIAADEGPTKVQPAPTTENDVAQNKLIYDRASPELAGDEQLVLPDDGPIDEAPASNESQASREISRIILPGAPGDSAAPSSIDDLAGGAAAAPAASADADAGPRKVRTVVVKPDGTIISSEAQPRNGTGAQAAPAAPAAAPATVAAAPQAAAPADDAPIQMSDDADGDAPAPAAAAPAAPQKDASQLEAPAVAPAKPKPAAAPAAATRAPASGGFVVQVASQRTEEAAIASYRAMQRKFPSVFGSQEPNVVRADLGAKGIYYRARVGPMATRDQAVSFCESLRSAGGDCIVQKN